MPKKFNFSRTEIQKLPTPEKRDYYYDLKTRGLVLDVRPTGGKTFQIYRKIKGAPIRVVLGSFNQDMPDSRDFPAGFDPLKLLNTNPELNVRMARAMGSSVNASLDKGQNVAETKREAKRKSDGEFTLRQAFNRYREDYLIPHGKKTVQDLSDNFSRYLGDVPDGQKKAHGKERTKASCAVNWEQRKLSSITPEEVRRLMIALKDDIGAYTANRTLELLRSVYNKAIEWKDFDGENPCIGIKKFSTSTRARFIKGEELPAFFNALAQSDSESFKHYIMLSLFTGARKSNVLGMKWEDIDSDRKVWTVPDSVSKNGEPMTIPLTRIASEVLESRKKAHDVWVFPAKSASGHMENPKKRWATLLSEAGLTNLRLHDLRRSLGSWAAMTGASLTIIGSALGHKSVAATQIYARLQSDPVLEAMERAASAIMSSAGLNEKAAAGKMG